MGALQSMGPLDVVYDVSSAEPVAAGMSSPMGSMLALVPAVDGALIAAVAQSTT
jgi:hypothetical protein